MANIGYATVSIIPSFSGFQGKMRAGLSGPLISEGKAAGESSGKSFASGFAKVTAGLAVASGALAFGKSIIGAATESAKVTKQTEAVLSSMGNQAGLTAKGVAALSTELSLQSGVDDEVIQSASNVLLTFGNIRNELGKGGKIFDRAQQSALDMSVALGTDLQGATIQVGKALNDPIKGITALSRAGVSFTEQQKDQITTLTKSGKSLDAQKIILSELEKQFGGSAKAQATAGDRLKVAFGNIQEQLGEKLLPAVEKLSQWLAEKLPGAMEKLGRVLGPIVRKLGEFGSWIVKNKPVLIAVTSVIGVGLVAAFTAWAIAAGSAAVSTIIATAPIIAIGAAIAALVAGVIWAYKNWDWFRIAVDRVASFITGTLVPAIAAIISTLVDWGTTAARIAGDVISFIGGVVEYVLGIPESIGSVLSGLAEVLIAPFRAAFTAIAELWNATIGKIEFTTPSWIPLIGDKKFAVPDIPVPKAASKSTGWGNKLPWGDSGGVWPGPKGVHSLGWVAGGETLIPTHKANMSPFNASQLGDASQLQLSLAPGAENQAMAWLLRLVRINRGFAAGIQGA